jgi:hypothetical protein
MTDITPKRTSEAWRSYTMHTRPWNAIAEFYRVIQAIAASPVAAQIHDSTLRICYHPTGRSDYF